jgi:hypothetical protein
MPTDFMSSLVARLLEFLSTGLPSPFFSSSLTPTYVLSLRDIILELIVGIPNNKCTIWCSWENALVAYRDAYDANTLVVTQCLEGFGTPHYPDTPLRIQIQTGMMVAVPWGCNLFPLKMTI